MNQEIAQILAAIPKHVALSAKILDSDGQLLASGEAMIGDGNEIHFLQYPKAHLDTLTQSAKFVAIDSFPAIPIAQSFYLGSLNCDYHFRIQRA